MEMKPTEHTPLNDFITNDLQSARSGSCGTQDASRSAPFGRNVAVAIVLVSVVMGATDGTSKHILLARGVPPFLSAAVGSLLRSFMAPPALFFISFLAGHSYESYKAACMVVLNGEARALFRWQVVLEAIVAMSYSLANSYETQPGVVAVLVGTAYLWSSIFEVALGMSQYSARVGNISVMAVAALALLVFLPKIDEKHTYVPSPVGCTLAGACGMAIAGTMVIYRLAALRSLQTLTAMPVAGAFGSLIAALASLCLLLLDPEQRAAAVPCLDGVHSRVGALFWPIITLNALMMTLYMIGLAVGSAHMSSFMVCILVLSEFIWAPIILFIFVGTWPVLLTFPGMLLLAAVISYAVWAAPSGQELNDDTIG